MIDATPLLRAYARFRRRQLARQDPARVQERQLFSLIRRAAFTRFGRDHEFDRLRSVADFQRAVPLRSYEDFLHEYWETGFPVITDVSWPGTVPYFAVTSGTTRDVTKYIPVTREMVRSNTRAGADLMVHHLTNRPASRILGGKNFMLGGSTDLTERAPGIRSGDLSGIAAREMPFWIRPRYFPPLELALISDWEEKTERLAREALDTDIRMIGGTPSWMLLFLDRLRELADGRSIAGIFPNLEMLVHGGVNFAPYHDRFASMLEGGKAEMREVYPASEGFVASADRGYGEGLRMNLDIGLFFEFVPAEEIDGDSPTRHWIADAETGVDYVLVLSNCAGVWAYVLGDTVKLVSRDPPRLLVTGRTAYTLSAFGEHVIGEELEEAVSEAAHDISAAVTDFSVGALYPDKEGERGGHLFIVEFSVALDDGGQAARFADILDRVLARLNEDYEAHRSGGFGMRPPEVWVLPPGGFAQWMKAQGKLGGQHKVPRVVNDAGRFDDLIRFARERSIAKATASGGTTG